VDGPGGRSAIVVPVMLPEPLEAIRQEHVAIARLGVPAHVTLLFPFVPAASLQSSDVARAAAAIARTAAFEVELREARTFDPGPTEEGAVWLAPEPPEPFIAMTEALVEAFPTYLPYGGIHDTVIPHLTLANLDVDVPALVAAAGPELPVVRRVEWAIVLVEDDRGRWRTARRLRLRRGGVSGIDSTVQGRLTGTQDRP
jgi:2'-5' RNA ligase